MSYNSTDVCSVFGVNLQHSQLNTINKCIMLQQVFIHQYTKLTVTAYNDFFDEIGIMYHSLPLRKILGRCKTNSLLPITCNRVCLRQNRS